MDSKQESLEFSKSTSTTVCFICNLWVASHNFCLGRIMHTTKITNHVFVMIIYHKSMKVDLSTRIGLLKDGVDGFTCATYGLFYGHPQQQKTQLYTHTLKN